METPGANDQQYIYSNVNKLSDKALYYARKNADKLTANSREYLTMARSVRYFNSSPRTLLLIKNTEICIVVNKFLATFLVQVARNLSTSVSC